MSSLFVSTKFGGTFWILRKLHTYVVAEFDWWWFECHIEMHAEVFALILISNVCLYVVHLHLYLYIHICGYIYMHNSLYMCVYSHMCLHVLICIHVYLYTCVPTFVCLFMCVYRGWEIREWYLFTYLFIFGCVGSLLLGGLSLVRASRRGYSLVAVAWASHCSGFSCCQAQALGHMGFSSCGSWTPEHRLNSCGPLS